ncbi:MAG: DUF4397 domain-containing protein [Clostridium sp.]
MKGYLKMSYNSNKNFNNQYHRSDNTSTNNNNNLATMDNLDYMGSLDLMNELENNEVTSNENAMSYVKVLHASPDAPAVDIYVDDELVVENLAYSEATDYLPLPAGSYNIKVYATDTIENPVIDTEVEIPESTRLTVAAVGNLSNLRLLPIPEDIATGMPQGTHIRVAHLSPDAPAIDVTTTDGDVIFEDVEFGEVTNYINVPRGVYTFQLRPTGTASVVLTISNVTFMPNFYYTIYVLGQIENEPGLQVFATVNRTPGILTTNFDEEFYPLQFEITSNGSNNTNTNETNTTNTTGTTNTSMPRAPKELNDVMKDFSKKYDNIYADLEKFGLDRKVSEYLVRLMLDYVNKNHDRYKGTVRKRANMAARDLNLLCPWIFDIMSCLKVPDRKTVDITITIVTYGFENL